MSCAQPPPTDTLRFLLELLRRDQGFSVVDHLFIEGVLRAEGGSLTLRLQELIGEAIVRPMFKPRAESGLFDSGAATPAASSAWRQVEIVVIDGFLASEEAEALREFALQHEGEFQASKIFLPEAKSGEISDSERRKSKVLLDLQEHYGSVVNRIKSVLPQVFETLQYPPFRMSQVEAQLTASNHGEFFKAHNDNTAEDLRGREITFVYYFYSEPKAFTGGELRIYDTYADGSHYGKGKSCRTISPRQNRIVFFPSCLVHEVLPIDCPSHLFANSRFTVNGWLHNAQWRVGPCEGVQGQPAQSASKGLPREMP